MNYNEFIGLKKLAKDKGYIRCYKDVGEIRFFSIIIFLLSFSVYSLITMQIRGITELGTSDPYFGLIVFITILTTIIFYIYLSNFKEKQIELFIQKKEKLRTTLYKKFIKKFVNKKQKKEKVYIAIDNLFSNLIKQALIKDNKDEFKLSKKEFHKMLSRQLKYDNKILKNKPY